MRSALFVTGLISFALLSACGSRSEHAPAEQVRAVAASSEPSSEKAWIAFTESFVADWMEAHPVFAFAAGRKEYAGKFPDWSAAGLAAEVKRLEGLREQALTFDSAALSQDQAFEREYLVAVIDRNLFWLAEAQWPFRNPEFYFDWGLDFLSPDPYLTKPYAPPGERMADYTRFANGLPNALAQIRSNLRTPMPRTYVELGISTFSGMAEFLRDDVPGVFSGVDDDELQDAFEKANANAVSALQELAAWFESLSATATEEFAIGPELFSAMLLKTEGLDVPLERIESIGRADLERNLQALDEACEEFAPGRDRPGCLAAMNANRPRGGAVLAAREQLGLIRNFLLEQRLVNIPSDDPVGVAEAPPYQRSNFAYINTAGPFDVGMPSTYYIAPPDPSWPEQEQLDYMPGQADLLSTSVHEVWPGHFLQFLHSNRAESIIGRLFVGYAYAEGWAHYAEEMMWEAGLSGGLEGGQAEFRIGQINKALYRNARLLCAVGMHTQGMSVEACETLFREQAFQDAGNARQQAARGTRDPGYLNYTLGKLMIRKLRADWTAERGGREAWREFHDEFLAHGGPPIPMLRRLMLEEQAGPAL